jgi:hypothetical protein
MPHLSITSMQDRDFLNRVISIIDPTATSLRVLMRKGNVLLGISNEKNAAERTLGLYQPQRLVARSIVSFLRVLSRFGLHGLMLQKMPMAAKSMDLHPPLCGIVPGSAGILVGSPEHKVRRAIVSYRNGAEWEVAKISFGDVGAKILEKEAATLNQLQSKATGAPRLLGLHQGDGVTVLRMPYLKGETIKPGETTDALNLLKSWVGSNDPWPIQRFSEWSHIETAIKSMPYGEKALEALSTKTLEPVICHGDFARWNLLKQTDGSLMVLDWEWGHNGGMPGIDLVHYFLQDARLVDRMPAKEAITKTCQILKSPDCAAYLKSTGWAGDPLLPIIASLAYKQGAGHQDNRDMLETLLNER